MSLCECVFNHGEKMRGIQLTQCVDECQSELSQILLEHDMMPLFMMISLRDHNTGVIHQFRYSVLAFKRYRYYCNTVVFTVNVNILPQLKQINM